MRGTKAETMWNSRKRKPCGQWNTRIRKQVLIFVPTLQDAGIDVANLVMSRTFDPVPA